MGDMTTEGANIGAGIDLSQFYQVFFEEAGENLDRMEAQLLEIDIEAADDEELNSIFRCAHSVKGGAATFGFADVAELTHQMETLLDKLRRHELEPTSAMVDVLLAAGRRAASAQLARAPGLGRASVARHQRAAGPASARWPNGQSSARARRPKRRARTRRSTSSTAEVAPPVPKAQAREPSKSGRRPARRSRRRPPTSLSELFKEIDRSRHDRTPGRRPAPADGMRRFPRHHDQQSDTDLLDLFTFHVARELIQMALPPVTDGYRLLSRRTPAPRPNRELAERRSGLRLLRATLPETRLGRTLRPVAPNGADEASTRRPRRPSPPRRRPPPPSRPRKSPWPRPSQATLRVSIEKVDQLINLVGELVITQAMLAQNSKQKDPAAQPAIRWPA